MRSLLRSNPVRFAVLLWFAGWMVLVMPGHTRGIVTLPDADRAAQADESGAASCCEPKPSCCEPGDADDCPDRPSDPARHCAICFLKAKMTDPPPVTLYTPYLGELDELAFQVDDSLADDQTAPKQLRGRAPPA